MTLTTDTLVAPFINAMAQGFSQISTVPIRYVYMSAEQAGAMWLALGLFALSFPLGWAVVRRHSPWITMLLTLPWVLPALVADIAPNWLFLMVMVASWLLLFVGNLSYRAAPRETARFTALATPVVALLLAVLTLLFPQAGYTQPQWAIAAQDTLADWGNWLYDSAFLSFILPDDLFPGGTGTGSSDQVNLAQAGPLRYSGRTVLEVRAANTGRIYLRGFSTGNYTGSSWEPLPEETYAPLESLGLFNRMTNPFFMPAYTSSSGGFSSLTINNVAASDDCVYFPYFLSAVGGLPQDISFVRDSYLAPGGSSSYTLYYTPDTLARGDFQYLSMVSENMAQAEAAYQAFVYQNYLSIPANFLDDIQPWLQEVAALNLPAADVSSYPQQYQYAVQTALEVTDQLAATTRYDPNVARTPSDEDFAVYFLTESQRGYCMHYATAATLLLRSYGIPARYVSGYTADVETAGEVTAVPDSAAHAWVEIYLPGYGWYPIEVTPPYETEATPSPDSTPSPSPSASPSPSTNANTGPSPSSRPSATPEAPADGDDTQTGSSLLWLWLSLGGLLLVVLALILRRQLGKWLWARRLHDPDNNRAVIAAYRYLSALVPWGGQISRPVKDLARKAKFSQHTLTQAERDTVLAYLSAERQRIEQALPWWKRFLLRYVWGLA